VSHIVGNRRQRCGLVCEDQAYPDFKVRHALRAASFCYPNWDAGLASSLLEDFGLLPGKAIKSLSRGQRSALGITIGLAARAEVTPFDEPCAGLDAVARQIFYDRLLAEYADFPRTVVLCLRGRLVSARALPGAAGHQQPERARHRVGHGYTQWTSYQPASRLWTFQWIEAGWLVALSVLLITATVWLVQRRAA
jgi:hypothetical protein